MSRYSGFFAVLLFSWPCLSLAQDNEAAASLDELLKEVQRAQVETSKINKAREETFLKRKDQQAALLSKAQSAKAVQEKRSRQLKATFEANKKTMADLRKQIDEKAGDLKQLQSIVKQAAGDFRVVARDSMISAQLPERQGFLDEMAESDRLPSADKLEKLWYLIQQEMTESGKVRQFKAPVIQPDGKTTESQVTRVGNFTVVSNGQYLNYTPDNGLEVVPRQPEITAAQQAQALEKARSGLHPVLIDPTRGSLFLLLTQKPELIDRIKQGGTVGYIIIGLGILGLSVALVQLLYLLFVGKRIRGQLKNPQQPKDDNALGRVLGSARMASLEDMETLELQLDEAILKETPKLERFQATIKLLAAVAPLMGLLGTVIGMIVTFQAITVFGTGDPKHLAGGISQALITTVLGLVAAIPLLFAHNLVASRSRNLIQVLDEQAAGLIARSAERRIKGQNNNRP